MSKLVSEQISEKMSELCEQMSEWMSKWLGTHIRDDLIYFLPNVHRHKQGQETPKNRPKMLAKHAIIVMNPFRESVVEAREAALPSH